MLCWHCDRPAHGVCKFCGRGLCRDHIQKMPYILELFQGKDGQHKALVVDDTLYCGVCKPQPAPVTLKDID
jgi:hypothetical protein